MRSLSAFSAEAHGSDFLLSYSKMYIGGIDPGELIKLTTSAPGFIGSMQQFILNGEEYFELASSGQLTNHKLNAVLVESSRDAGVHHAVSFTAQNTYIGLPQMKAYNSINIRWVIDPTNACLHL
jgi:hypothetical protein